MTNINSFSLLDAPGGNAFRPYQYIPAALGEMDGYGVEIAVILQGIGDDKHQRR
jgi:hypothetical protein